MFDCFIIARLSSARLPKKNILKINNKPSILNLHNRIKKSKFIDRIIVCTSIEKSDDELESICKHADINIYRGSLSNIMERIVKCANKFKTKKIIEILGDNPLIDGKLIDDVINFSDSQKFDYVANISKDYKKEIQNKKYKLFPIGLRVQIYNTDAAKQYLNFNKKKFVSPHPTNFIFESKNIFKCGYLEAKNKWRFVNLKDLNFAVNNKSQFNNVKKIFEYFKDDNFSIKDMVEYLNNNQLLKNFI